MAKEKILVVEDDSGISRLIAYNLDKAGYKATVAESGEQALELIQNEVFDLFVLDLMLPGMDGLELCRRVRQDARLSASPVVIVSAKGEEVDRIVGVELGADDYVVKPFSPRELVLRVKAVLKRGRQGSAAAEGAETVRAGDIEIDTARHRVCVAGEELVLTLTEFKLLLTLVSRRGRVQSREKLLSDVWEIDADITTRTVDTHIKRLRQKLGASAGEHIETVRGIGYRFCETD